MHILLYRSFHCLDLNKQYCKNDDECYSTALLNIWVGTHNIFITSYKNRHSTPIQFVICTMVNPLFVPATFSCIYSLIFVLYQSGGTLAEMLVEMWHTPRPGHKSIA